MQTEIVIVNNESDDHSKSSSRARHVTSDVHSRVRAAP